MNKHISEKQAAQLVSYYYEIIDNYTQDCSVVENVCLEQFSNYNLSSQRKNINSVITLFLMRSTLNQSILALDEIGAEECIKHLQQSFFKIDSTLRAVVAKITGKYITPGSVAPDELLMNRFNYNLENVIQFRPRMKKT